MSDHATTTTAHAPYNPTEHDPFNKTWGIPGIIVGVVVGGILSLPGTLLIGKSVQEFGTYAINQAPSGLGWLPILMGTALLVIGFVAWGLRLKESSNEAYFPPESLVGADGVEDVHRQWEIYDQRVLLIKYRRAAAIDMIGFAVIALLVGLIGCYAVNAGYLDAYNDESPSASGSGTFFLSGLAGFVAYAFAVFALFYSPKRYWVGWIIGGVLAVAAALLLPYGFGAWLGHLDAGHFAN